jgi:hypothetical protein
MGVSDGSPVCVFTRRRGGRLVRSYRAFLRVGVARNLYGFLSPAKGQDPQVVAGVGRRNHEEDVLSVRRPVGDNNIVPVTSEAMNATDVATS